MKNILSCLLLILLVSACSSPTLDETLYVKIASEAICAEVDNDTAVYARYGITPEQMDQYRLSLTTDKVRAEKVGRAILEQVGKCLGGE